MTNKQKPKDAPGIDKKLVKAVDDLVEKVKLGATDEDGKKYTLTDVMKVLDRKIELEKIRTKFNDTGEGTYFNQGADDESQ